MYDQIVNIHAAAFRLVSSSSEAFFRPQQKALQYCVKLLMMMAHILLTCIGWMGEICESFRIIIITIFIIIIFIFFL